MRPATIAVAVGFALSACATSGEVAPPDPALDAIAMGILSWGRPVTSWEIDDEGNGVYRSAERAPSGHFDEYDLVSRRFAVGREGFLRIRTLLQPAERYAGRRVPCQDGMTDLPYGQLTWTYAGVASVMHYNFGCTSRRANAVYELMGQAQAVVVEWTAQAPVSEIQEVRRPSGSASPP